LRISVECYFIDVAMNINSLFHGALHIILQNITFYI